MLLGLALIAVPLLVAVVDAAIQIRSQSRLSQALVLEGVQTARLSQSMFADIASLARTVRLYQILGDTKVLDGYRRTDQGLAGTRAQLASLLNDEPTRRSLEDFAVVHNEISNAVSSTSPNSPAFASVLTRFDRLSDLAKDIADNGNRQIDVRLADLQRHTTSTQKRLFWQSALLVPLTLIAILSLTLSIGRPLRAIDRAISELGRGTFSRSIEVSGPRDLERLGAQLEWLRLRLLDLAQDNGDENKLVDPAGPVAYFTTFETWHRMPALRRRHRARTGRRWLTTARPMSISSSMSGRFRQLTRMSTGSASATGSLVGSAFAIANTAARHERRPRLAYNANSNNYLVIWEFDQSGNGSNYNLQARPVSAAGAPGSTVNVANQPRRRAPEMAFGLTSANTWSPTSGTAITTAKLISACCG